jgi:cytochrome c oxidase assembly factor CtaG
LLFWNAVLEPRVRRRGSGAAILGLFLTATVGGALGALMALSSSPWYSAYAQMGMTPFGLTPTQDQQLAGLLMWVPGGLVHLAAALMLLARWLRPSVAEAVHAPD